jgi:subtilisin family serine protease
MYANLNKATYAPSPTWESAIIAAYNLGIITVVAAGNNDVRCPL